MKFLSIGSDFIEHLEEKVKKAWTLSGGDGKVVLSDVSAYALLEELKRFRDMKEPEA